jgi:hypothetical protein
MSLRRSADLLSQQDLDGGQVRVVPRVVAKDVSDNNLAIRRDAAAPVKTGVGEVARQSIAMHLCAHQQHLIRVRRSYRCDDVALLRQAQRLRPEVHVRNQHRLCVVRRTLVTSSAIRHQIDARGAVH